MARLSQQVPTQAQSDNSSMSDNIVVAPRKQTQSAGKQPEMPEDQHTISSGPSTRIPETVLDEQAARPAPHQPVPQQPTQRAREPYQLSPIDNLRIRNAIQREEIRMKNREMRQDHDELAVLRRDAVACRDELEHYRNTLRKTTQWMEASWFCALVLFLCIVLYVAWCWFNSAEFEFQDKVVRRNLGLE